MRHLRLAVPTLVLVFGLTACGSDDGGVNAAGDSVGGGSSTEEQILEFYECLREGGLDVSDPPPGQPMVRIDPGEIDLADPEVQAVYEECRQYLPGGGEMSAPDEQGLESMREFTQCMRDNGVDMPDPGADGTLYAPEGMHYSDPEFAAASEACRHLMAGQPMRIMPPGGTAP